MTECFCRVGISLHALHKDPEMAHYNYEVLTDRVLSSAPAAVLGEIRPEDWEAHLAGRTGGYLGPVEYRECLLPLLEEHVRAHGLLRGANIGTGSATDRAGT